MKFSINNLLSKYNLVLIISILFIVWIIYKLITSNSCKEHMNDASINNIIDMRPNYSNMPICTFLNETKCSKNNYCKWNVDKQICNKLDVCHLLGEEQCTTSRNCIWTKANRTKANKLCSYK